MTGSAGRAWRGRRLRLAALGVAALLPLALLAPARALVTGSLTLAQLGGFEIDGNMQLDHGTYDWSNAGGSAGPTTCSALAAGSFAHVGGPLDLFCANDTATGQNDNSINGHEQDTTVRVVCGSIPNGKSDLSNFYVGSQSVSGHSVLYLGWTISSTGGSADMDFEFNQLAQDPALSSGTVGGPPCPSGSGTAVNVGATRSPGDLLVEYQFQSGGNSVSIKLTRWTTTAGAACATSQAPPCWGPETDLTTASAANGAINDASTPDQFSTNCPSASTPVSKQVQGCIVNTLSGGTLGPQQFGEAGIDLTAANVFPAGTCETFGSAYLKSRSSAVFTDAVKDEIAPVPVHVTNCVTPTLATQVKDSGGSSTSSVAVGDSVTDTATISGFLGANPPGGTVAFNVYSGTTSTSCTTANLVETLPAGASASGTNGDAFVAGNASPPTATATQTITTGAGGLPPGSYEIQAAYTGDGNQNLKTASTCGTEPLTVNKKQPTLATTASAPASITAGQTVTIGDTATLSNAYAPNGSVTVTFALYGPTSAPGSNPAPSCTAADQVTLSGTLTTNSWTATTTAGQFTASISGISFTPSAAGTYYWVASTSADANNSSAGPAGCGVQAESITVGKATPGISTFMSLKDTVNLTGTTGVSPNPPTGTVTFTLIGPLSQGTTGSSACANPTPALYSKSFTLTSASNGTVSSDVVDVPTTKAGQYYWLVQFTPDAASSPNYNGASSSCTEAANIAYS